MPPELIRALAWVKWAAAWANRDLGRLDPNQAQAIVRAAEQVAAGEFDASFPLSLWHGGAAARADDTMNEVLAKMASQPPRDFWHEARRVDSPTDVNLGQRAGPVFTAAAQVAVALQAKARVLPALAGLRAFAGGAGAGSAPARCDASLALCEDHLRHALGAVHVLVLADAADDGAGSVRPTGFGERMAERLAQRLELPLTDGGPALAGRQPLVPVHGALRALAIVLARIEDQLPPQAMPDASALQALAMVCARVVGHDAGIGFAAGRASPDVFEPLIVMDTLDSMRLLADAMTACSQQRTAPIP